MFAWIRERLRRRTSPEPPPPPERDGDGEDAVETREALLEEESGPGMPRVKTRNL